MAKEAVFTMKLEPELRDAFMAAAQREDRPASQIMREFMREYVDSREEQERSYAEFLRRRVEKSRRSIAEGKWFTSEEVEARAAARRAELQRRVDEKDS